MNNKNGLFATTIIVLAMMILSSFGGTYTSTLPNKTSTDFVVTGGPTLSSPDGIPGYPVTISAEVSGFSIGDSWVDDMEEFGEYRIAGDGWYEYGGDGVFDCEEIFDVDATYTYTTGYVYDPDHVIPLEWAEDGIDDCYDGSDEVSGASTSQSTGQQQTTYKIMAVSSTGEEYVIKSGLSPLDGEISANWDVPDIQPTGSYSICVEPTQGGATEWTMGWDPYEPSYYAQYREYRTLVPLTSSTISSSCTYFELNLYDVSLSSDHNIVVPGSTVVIDGFVSNPITGGPSNPGSIDARLRYYTEDSETGSAVSQEQEIYVNANTAIFDFAFILPSNLYQGEFSSYRQLYVDVWANSSNSNQFEYVIIGMRAGSVYSDIIEPANTDLVYRDEPFIFRAETYVYDDHYDYEPVSGHELSLKIVSTKNGQTDWTTIIFSDVETDRTGRILHLIDLSDTEVSGVATLVLEWNNPATMETDRQQVMIFVADSTYITNNLGQGLNLEAEIVGDSPHEGEDVTISISAMDDWGNPISSIYVQHYLQIEVGLLTVWDVVTLEEQFGYGMTNQTGEILVIFSIPSGLNDAEISVVLVGYNETGFLDEMDFEIPLAEPEVDVQMSDEYYHPGKLTNLYFNCTDLQGEVTYFWETTSGEDGFISTPNCDTTAMVEFIIPLSQDSNFYHVSVAAVGEKRVVTDMFSFQKFEDTVQIDIILSSPGANKAGDNISVYYNITIDDDNMSNYFPISWEASIGGYSPYDFQNVLNESVGDLTITLPDSLSSGQHVVVFEFRFGDDMVVPSYTIVEVISQEDDKEQGEIRDSLSYQIESQASNIAMVSLFVALSSLLYMVISRPKGSKESSFESKSLVFDTPSQPLVPLQAMEAPLPPLQASNLPPADAVGTVSGGHEWIVHLGQDYYRPAASNEDWKLYQS